MLEVLVSVHAVEAASSLILVLFDYDNQPHASHEYVDLLV